MQFIWTVKIIISRYVLLNPFIVFGRYWQTMYKTVPEVCDICQNAEYIRESIMRTWCLILDDIEIVTSQYYYLSVDILLIDFNRVHI